MRPVLLSFNNKEKKREVVSFSNVKEGGCGMTYTNALEYTD